MKVTNNIGTLSVTDRKSAISKMVDPTFVCSLERESILPLYTQGAHDELRAGSWHVQWKARLTASNSKAAEEEYTAEQGRHLHVEGWDFLWFVPINDAQDRWKFRDPR